MTKETVQAKCLCGHGFSHHPPGTNGGACQDICHHNGPTHSCRCPKFVLWDERSERNDFAKAALSGLLASAGHWEERHTVTETAGFAFDIADAMIAEAKRRDGDRA